MILRNGLSYRRMFSHLVSVQRCLQRASSEETTPHVKPTKEIRFNTVYKFPHIRLMAAFNTAKVAAAVASVVIIPICGALGAAGLCSFDAFYIAAYIGISSTAAFSLINLWTRNVIGFLYVSEDGQQIKISYVDYWGRRQNLVVPANDWTPIFDLPIKDSNYLYTTPCIANNSIHLKLIRRFGGVTDKEKMGYYFE